MAFFLGVSLCGNSVTTHPFPPHICYCSIFLILEYCALGYVVVTRNNFGISANCQKVICQKPFLSYNICQTVKSQKANCHRIINVKSIKYDIMVFKKVLSAQIMFRDKIIYLLNSIGNHGQGKK